MAKTTSKTTKKSAAKATKAPAKKKAVSKKSTVKKTTTKKATAKRATAPDTKTKASAHATKRKTAASRVSGAKTTQISASQRHQMICEAAYLRGEAQGFLSDDYEDWLLAEAEIDARLTKARIAIKD
jgi:septal ring-binding cell division protein DamX